MLVCLLRAACQDLARARTFACTSDGGAWKSIEDGGELHPYATIPSQRPGTSKIALSYNG